MEPSQSQIIAQNPIGKRLDSFQEAFRSTCAKLSISASADAVQQVVKNGSKGLISHLIFVLQGLPASWLLSSSDGRSTLAGELATLFAKVQSNQQDLQAIVPLLTKVIEKAPDGEIWDAVYKLVAKSAPQPTPLTEFTPPATPGELTTPRKPRPSGEFTTPNRSMLLENPQLSQLHQTPTVQNTAGIVNSSESRAYFDKELKMELGTSVYIGVPGFVEAFFGGVLNLQSIAKTVFEKCQEGDDPLFNKEAGGWQRWPSDANEDKVLEWFQRIMKKFLDLAAESYTLPSPRMRILRQPNKPVPNSVSKRKLDIGFVHKTKTRGQAEYDWSLILIPGELKSNPKEDTHESTWLDLARYAREVFIAQDTRRFVQGFTLCGSLMRLWEFDRLGGIASSTFDINKDGLEFVSAILGYLWMTDEQLGFDPTITSEGVNRYMTITKEGKTERLVIVDVIKPYHSIIGRGTICWKAYHEGDESKKLLVVKDSWQYPERDEEGEYLLEATKSGAVNMARYYHHETVCVGGKDDAIVDNVRKGLDIGGAKNAYKIIAKMKKEEDKKQQEDLRRSMAQLMIQSKARGRDANTSLSLHMPAVSTTPQKDEADPPRFDRVHRRVILHDYGRPLYEASSRVAMLAALEGGITGHQSLHQKAGILHRDISINNVLVNDEDNSTWPGFLIDLDLAIRENRLELSGAQDKTGTKVFMSIGALEGDKHSFMDDLESFFWVLFWICIHYTGLNEPSRVVDAYEKWNYTSTDDLAMIKSGIISDEFGFLRRMFASVAPYFQPLIPCINELRKVVFPNDKRWRSKDEGLYERMREVLREAMKDPKVQAG